MIFYIGFHDGNGTDPTLKEERVFKVPYDYKQSGKLFRALVAIFKYLTGVSDD